MCIWLTCFVVISGLVGVGGGDLALRQTRILHGVPVSQAAYPWMATIRVKLSARQAMRCGGTLIATRWVLTAAHCVKGNPTRDHGDRTATVYLGAQRLAPVRRVLPHPRYRTPNAPGATAFDFDIALVQLSRPVPRHVAMPLPLVDAAGIGGAPDTRALVLGRGRTETELRPTALRQGFVRLVNHDACPAFASNNPARKLCAVIATNGTGICTGDSGGPLLVLLDHRRHRHQQIGIASYVQHAPDGRCHSVNVFTDVAAYRSWIDRIITAPNRKVSAL